MNNDFENKIKQVSGQALNSLVKRLPGIAKKEGLQFIQDNFDKQGFEEKPGVVKKWQKRKPRPGRLTRKDEGRAILVKSGALKRSWGNNSRTAGDKVEFTSDRVYAARHNEGLNGMPQRQMIGDSSELINRITDKFEKELTKLFK